MSNTDDSKDELRLIKIAYARRLLRHLRMIKLRIGIGACVVHNRALITSMPSDVLFKRYCRATKGSVKCPEQLTICLVHNYPDEPIMEQSLQYLGIRDYVVLRPDCVPWRHTQKLEAIYEFLRTDSPYARREFFMFIDSDDAILAKEPGEAVALLLRSDCDLLFSATGWPGGLIFAPDKIAFFENRIREATHRFKNAAFVNTGCYIGRTEFIKRVLSEIMRFITDSDLTPSELKTAVSSKTLPEKFNREDFPAGFGCDQAVMAYLPSEYWERIKIDYHHRLAFR
jgi:hypothetical protein